MLSISLLGLAALAASPQLVCHPGWTLQGEACVASAPAVEVAPAPAYVPPPPTVYLPPPAAYVPPPAPPAGYLPPPVEIAPQPPAPPAVYAPPVVVPPVPAVPVPPVVVPAVPVAPVVPAVPVVAPVPVPPSPPPAVAAPARRPPAASPARDYSNRRWLTELAFTYDARARLPGGLVMLDIPIGRGAHVFSIDLGVGLMGGEIQGESLLVMQVPFGVSMRFGFGMGFQVIPSLALVGHLSRLDDDAEFGFKMGGGLKFHVPFGARSKAGVNVGVQVLGLKGTAALLSTGITF